jgi:hypothetical protein
MTRTVADLTDDEIVDAVAKHGLVGVNWSFDGGPDDVGHVLVMLDVENGDGERDALRERVAELRDCGDDDRLRWCDGHDCYIIGLTPFEWGKRLANLPATDIAKMLAGET